MDSQTSLNLLNRLKTEPADESAWTEFVRRYQHTIRGWCLSQRLQPADADEVTQIVLVKLMEKMRHFEYDPAGSFRAWLKTVTRHAWNDFLDGERRRTSGESKVGALLELLEARTDLDERLAESFDQELLAAAQARVQERVAPATWEAFRLTALDGKTGKEAARSLNIPVAHVYVAKRRVQQMLQDEIRSLEKS